MGSSSWADNGKQVISNRKIAVILTMSLLYLVFIFFSPISLFQMLDTSVCCLEPKSELACQTIIGGFSYLNAYIKE